MTTQSAFTDTNHIHLFTPIHILVPEAISHGPSALTIHIYLHPDDTASGTVWDAVSVNLWMTMPILFHRLQGYWGIGGAHLVPLQITLMTIQFHLAK